MSLNKVDVARTSEGTYVYVYPHGAVAKANPNGGLDQGPYHWRCYENYLDYHLYGEGPITKDFPPNAVRPFRQLVINERNFFI